MSEIRQFMSESHHAVGRDQSLKFAHDRMQQFGLQQLPVLDGGVLVGVLSDRDIALIGAVAPARLDDISVEDAMADAPYAVAPSDDLAAVTAHMVLHKYGSAVVMEHNKVIGVFTANDALALLARLLEQPGRAAELIKVGSRPPGPKLGEGRAERSSAKK